MLNFILRMLFGSKFERDVKKLVPLVEKINEYDETFKKATDDELRAKTEFFKSQLKEGLTLDDILPEAFAVIREAASRVIGEKPYDVQIMGGITLHQGKIAEMKTGEGKTLSATMPVYLNALEGKGVHVVTVNDYLAKRDREWMGPIYEFLGLSVGVIQHDMPHQYKQLAYNCDISYGTNNEFGFDYLRDNMVDHKSLRMQRAHNFCIVDEVDSILIDEARTPLIISGPSEESTDKYYKINKLVPRLQSKEDYEIEEKNHSVFLTDNGNKVVEKLLTLDNLYSNENVELVHHINQALRAHHLFKRDVDYVVKDGQVIIVDEFTGRLMPGRRYSDGLHQALEAKENVRIENENQTLATITFQNYFKLYKKLSGMTGTADTEAEEFAKIYKLDVTVIPTNLPMVRIDNPDRIYRTEKEKFKAIIREIEDCYKRRQPVLVGTISIEKSEILSRMLKEIAVPHQVLNAKYHEQEASIIKNAGVASMVTIATNMAGRGTDIKLGPGVVDVGGLHILGTERHEARRIDNQLRGRSGRQGDPGSSRFYLSLEDELLRLFGSDRLSGLMFKMGMTEGQEIEHPWLSRAIENAQKRVEARNFDIRKHLLEYDDVMNMQRDFIYGKRNQIIEEGNLKQDILEALKDVIDANLGSLVDKRSRPEHWDLDPVYSWFWNILGVDLHSGFGKNFALSSLDDFSDSVYNIACEAYAMKEKEFGDENMRYLERAVMLHIIDTHWKNHLYAMDQLKEGIGLRAYGERNPLTEYKFEGYNMFKEMIEKIKYDVVQFIFKIKTAPEQRPQEKEVQYQEKGITQHQEVGQFSALRQQAAHKESDESRQVARAQPSKPAQEGMKKVGRNEPCPCGSGKKYKHCHGR